MLSLIINKDIVNDNNLYFVEFYVTPKYRNKFEEIIKTVSKFKASNGVIIDFNSISNIIKLDYDSILNLLYALREFNLKYVN